MRVLDDRAAGTIPRSEREAEFGAHYIAVIYPQTACDS